MNYEVVSIDVNTEYNLTVTDINGDDVISIQQLYVNFSSSFTSNRSGLQEI